MTVKVTLPTPGQPYLETGLLPADFYAYEELLSETEREKVGRIRDFFRTEAAPIVDGYWARAEFPFELVKGFAKLGLLDWADPDSTEPAPSNLLTGITSMEMAHADRRCRCSSVCTPDWRWAPSSPAGPRSRSGGGCLR